ncbi:MAG: sigma-70 family RNA polymerase sigma factor [Nocardioidaceae bacterium]|nr:sigma-70 family RNA polymerase sigma factor [Nocardioidaceae bacterium]NUS51350.1 sigma-70 family RNA polymerase sigma factor [Nocardioidaceae bacterium]
MDERSSDELLAREFEQHRTHLRAVALRMLGSVNEADDAVQEAWIRLSRADAGTLDNLAGWLTTVVSRVCLDMLRSRTSRREAPWEQAGPAAVPGPEQESVLADSVGVAMLVVLERLSPAERLAFVLHDMFAVPFDEVGTIMARSPAAVRQLASRGRRRVQSPQTSLDDERSAHRAVVDAFLAASRGGDFQGLLDLLAPDVALRADAAAVAMGAQGDVVGAHEVAATFSGRARAARTGLLDGYAAAVWSVGGSPKVVFGFLVEDGLITEIEMLADPDQLSRLDLAPAD